MIMRERGKEYSREGEEEEKEEAMEDEEYTIAKFIEQ